ncbi:SurA N-terminal domain-containing protein [Candidatus Pelagibacter sp.]|nr:SurA N-terminal domain-containing protein [Candidatus Pelagibacter sp.]
MLNKLRNFTKTKLATVLIGIIIIPFVFWGMGGVFQGGNTNNIAKIKNVNISTEDFFNHIKSLGINEEIISKNIENDILKEILNDLLAKKFLELEIKKLGINLNDESLLLIIKNNKNFLDENKKFSRLKYEKFLLENNITASEFEKRLRKRELERILFSYYGSGLYIPEYLVNYFNYNENRSIYAKYVSLESNYKKEDEFNDVDIKNYIEANKEDLKIDFIDVKYAKLTPEILTGSSEYNENYYEIIDEIENKILSQNNLEGLLSEYKGVKINDLKELSKKNVDKDLQDIFNYKESDLVQILDKEDYFLVFRNTNYRKKVPTLDETFSTEIKEILYKESRYNYNQKLFSKINSDKFSDDDFNKSVKNKDEYKEILIKSIKDNNTFEINSVELIYSMPINSYVLVTDDKEKVYLLKILGVKKNDFKSGDKEIFLKTKDKIMNEIYSSYDQFLNQNYKVEINYNTLERTENYFK